MVLVFLWSHNMSHKANRKVVTPHPQLHEMPRHTVFWHYLWLFIGQFRESIPQSSIRPIFSTLVTYPWAFVSQFKLVVKLYIGVGLRDWVQWRLVPLWLSCLHMCRRVIATFILYQRLSSFCKTGNGFLYYIIKQEWSQCITLKTRVVCVLHCRPEWSAYYITDQNGQCITLQTRMVSVLHYRPECQCITLQTRMISLLHYRPEWPVY